MSNHQQPDDDVSIQRQVFRAAEENVEDLKAIIKAGYVPIKIVNALGQTLAHIAAKVGNLEVLEYVLEEDPDLAHEKDNDNCSVLQVAVVNGKLEVVKYLIEEHNVDIEYLGGHFKDRTALHVAIEFNRLDILKYLVDEKHIDYNCPNPKQIIPPIFLAIRRRNWDVIEYLVEEKRANLKAINRKNQENILFTIVRENAMSIMEYILDERGIELNVDWKNYYGETSAHVAVKYDRFEMLQYLVEKKFANINIQKRTDKRTPLHYAAAHDMFDICQFLIERGADPRIQDSYGEIPADKAKDVRLINYLENATYARRPRSVASPLYSPEPVPLPHFKITQPESVGQLAESVGYSYVEGNKSFIRSSVDLSYFHGFLFLAKLFINSVETERWTENSVYNASPSSIIRSKMSSIAMEVLNGETNFN